MLIYNVTPRLGEILKERNLTQKQLADMTGISQPVISRFDRNGQHLDVHLVTISRALEISINDLFHLEVRDPNKMYIDINLPND